LEFEVDKNHLFEVPLNNVSTRTVIAKNEVTLWVPSEWWCCSLTDRTAVSHSIRC